jgi:hypothetical protein
MKKTLFVLTLVSTFILGVSFNTPFYGSNPVININNFAIAAEDMHTDMGNEHQSEEKDDHESQAGGHEEKNSHDDKTSQEETNSHEEKNSQEEKSSHEETKGGHGDQGSSEYTAPNLIFLVMLVNIMVISIVISTIIKQRRGRVENESRN